VVVVVVVVVVVTVVSGGAGVRVVVHVVHVVRVVARVVVPVRRVVVAVVFCTEVVTVVWAVAVLVAVVTVVRPVVSVGIHVGSGSSVADEEVEAVTVGLVTVTEAEVTIVDGIVLFVGDGDLVVSCVAVVRSAVGTAAVLFAVVLSEIGEVVLVVTVSVCVGGVTVVGCVVGRDGTNRSSGTW